MGVIGDYVLLFKNPLLSIKNNTFYIFRKKTHGFETEIILGDFKDLLYKLGKQIEIIEVSEEREAYDDACNVLTVSPNKILTYDRGQKTIALLGEKGFLKVIFDEDQKMWILYGYKNAEWEYINTYSDIKSFMKIDSKLIFEIPGSELILARGGCHCMSMPLTRI
jgi:arginine deiminase